MLRFSSLALFEVAHSSVPEARYNLCRWREPPAREQSKDRRPSGPIHGVCASPSGLRLPLALQPVVYTTGKGFTDPSRRKRATSKLALQASIVSLTNLATVSLLLPDLISLV